MAHMLKEETRDGWRVVYFADDIDGQTSVRAIFEADDLDTALDAMRETHTETQGIRCLNEFELDNEMG